MIEWRAYEHPIVVPRGDRLILALFRDHVPGSNSDRSNAILVLPLPAMRGAPEGGERHQLDVIEADLSVGVRRSNDSPRPAMSVKHRMWETLEEIAAYVRANPELCGEALADRLLELHTTSIGMDAADVDPLADLRGAVP